jgi:hypothetical protein
MCDQNYADTILYGFVGYYMKMYKLIKIQK